MKRDFTKSSYIRFGSFAVLFGLLTMVPCASFSQKGISKGEKDLMHHEVIGDKYVPGSNNKGETSPAYKYESSIFFMTQVNIDENGENILGDAGNEPSIAVDPTNPDRMAIGWRQFDDVSNNFRQAGYGYTLDGGETWTFPGVINPGVFRSDPVLDADNDGRFYYNSLTVDNNDNMWCDVYRTEVGGVEWGEPVYAQGGDKQWMRIDRTESTGAGNIYAIWNQSWSICQPGFFTRSTDGGDSYEDCTEIDGSPFWGTLAVDGDGNLYTVGAGGWGDEVIVVKSTNASNAGNPVSWQNAVTVDLDGYMTGWTNVNPAGLLGQAWIDVDKSGGPGDGNVYVLASVARNSSNDEGDVMFTKSTDGGDTWSAPVRINDDIGTSNIQWFGTMSVAPNGRIDVVWLDTRDDNPGTYWSSLYYSYSLDQGETWSVNERLSEAFDPHVGWPNQNKMGDYFDMVSDNSSAHLAWANTLNGEQDVYYGRITPQLTGINNRSKQDFLSVTNYPNPFKGETTIRYKLNNQGDVKITIFDVYGKEIKTIVNENKQPGSYSIVFKAENDLPAGVYYCRMTSGTSTKTVSMMLIR